MFIIIPLNLILLPIHLLVLVSSLVGHLLAWMIRMLVEARRPADPSSQAGGSDVERQ